MERLCESRRKFLQCFLAEFYEWVQVVSGIGYTLFVVAVGSYVLLWLAARLRDGAYA